MQEPITLEAVKSFTDKKALKKVNSDIFLKMDWYCVMKKVRYVLNKLIMGRV